MDDPKKVFERIVEAFKKGLLDMMASKDDYVLIVRLGKKGGEITVGCWTEDDFKTMFVADILRRRREGASPGHCPDEGEADGTEPASDGTDFLFGELKDGDEFHA